MPRYKTFVQAGRLLSEDLNAMQDQYELGYQGYKFLCHRYIRVLYSVVSGTKYVAGSFYGDITRAVNSTSTHTNHAFYLPVSGFTAGTRPVKILATGSFFKNVTGTPDYNLTFGFGTVTFTAGATDIPYINALTSEASTTVGPVLSDVVYTGVTNPVTVTTNADRAAYFSVDITGSVSTLNGVITIYYKQE